MLNQANERSSKLTNNQEQIERFLVTLFEPDDVIEFRSIETWTEHGRKVSRLLERDWLRRDAVPKEIPHLQRINKNANIFFSVQPRTNRGGTKNSVALCRCIWVDLDDVDRDEAARRWQKLSIVPSVVVNSGHGIHAYWRLVDPKAVTTPETRAAFEAIVKGFATALGGDSTHDCTRLLRLPGTWNVKNKRNGALPVECTVVSLDESRRHSYSAFEAVVRRKVNDMAANREAMKRCHASLSSSHIVRSPDHRRLQGVLRYLDREVEDRSRRDFAAVSLCIQLGLSKEELWQMVRDKSKFATDGKAYFETTFENAMKSFYGK